MFCVKRSVLASHWKRYIFKHSGQPINIPIKKGRKLNTLSAEKRIFTRIPAEISDNTESVGWPLFKHFACPNKNNSELIDSTLSKLPLLHGTPTFCPPFSNMHLLPVRVPLSKFVCPQGTIAQSATISLGQMDWVPFCHSFAWAASFPHTMSNRSWHKLYCTFLLNISAKWPEARVHHVRIVNSNQEITKRHIYRYTG